MKRKITISISIAVSLFIIFQGSQKFAMSYDGSSPAGYCGDPAGGNKNCTQCHNGTLNTVTGWITSDIPGTGYVPGTTYQITATSTGTNGNKGFQISPQNSGGTFLGTLIAGTGTSLTGTNHYVRSSGQSITTNPMTWNFSWTAPAVGSGDVTFYGAFVLGYGVLCNLCTYTVSESSVGLTETKNEFGTLSIYPNPVCDNLFINYIVSADSKVVINVYSLEGKKVACLMNCKQASGSYAEKLSINNLVSKGTFVIELKIGESSTYKKVVVG